LDSTGGRWRTTGEAQQARHFCAFGVIDQRDRRANVLRVDACGQTRRVLYELRSRRVHQQEMIERDKRTTEIAAHGSARADADPGHEAIDRMRRRLGSDATNPNDSVELPRPNAAHTAIDPKSATRIGIPGVSPLVDEGAWNSVHERAGLL
jgi:hypothetical protein